MKFQVFTYCVLQWLLSCNKSLVVRDTFYFHITFLNSAAYSDFRFLCNILLRHPLGPRGFLWVWYLNPGKSTLLSNLILELLGITGTYFWPRARSLRGPQELQNLVATSLVSVFLGLVTQKSPNIPGWFLIRKPADWIRPQLKGLRPLRLWKELLILTGKSRHSSPA